ncbi:hypothetical protein GYMC10_1576 [Paenibacillus sp. Y412MC10]|nr:hypothetical protein GYMC10_1576 [Paenibacillus sp. Y412MC10]
MAMIRERQKEPEIISGSAYKNPHLWHATLC